MANNSSRKSTNGSGLDFETTTWKLARMNLSIRGIDINLGPRNADGFRTDLHPDLEANLVSVWKDLANPPMNNANCVWIQYFIHRFSPVGVAGFVLANGSNSTQTSNKGEILKAKRTQP